MGRTRNAAAGAPEIPLVLPARLDLIQAQPLYDALHERIGRRVEIDAGKVDHLGTLCLQILLAAHGAWRSDGVPFVVSPRSPAFMSALCTFGIDTELLASGGAS